MSLELTWIAIDADGRVIVGCAPSVAPRPSNAHILEAEPDLEDILFDLLAFTAPPEDQPALYYRYAGQGYVLEHGRGTLRVEDLPRSIQHRLTAPVPSPEPSGPAPWHSDALARAVAGDIVRMVYLCALASDDVPLQSTALPPLPSLVGLPLEPVAVEPLVRLCLGFDSLAPLVDEQRLAGTRFGGLVKQWHATPHRWVVPPERLVARLPHLYRALGTDGWSAFCADVVALYRHSAAAPSPDVQDWLESWVHVLPWSVLGNAMPGPPLRLSPPRPTPTQAAYCWASAR